MGCSDSNMGIGVSPKSMSATSKANEEKAMFETKKKSKFH